MKDKEIDEMSRGEMWWEIAKLQGKLYEALLGILVFCGWIVPPLRTLSVIQYLAAMIGISLAITIVVFLSTVIIAIWFWKEPDELSEPIL